jgi:hypothetical protein
VLDIFEIGFHKLFARGWLRTTILLISAFQVARSTGVSHGTWPNVCLMSSFWAFSSSSPSFTPPLMLEWNPERHTQ